MKRMWNPDAVAKNRAFRRKYGPLLDGVYINKIAAYVSVFAAASALILAGFIAHKCGNDWLDAFAGIAFLVLGGLMWGWNALVGLYAILNAINLYGLKHRHRLPVFQIIVFSALFGVIASSGMIVSRIAIDLEFRGSQVCSS
ncbi:hypothetical protein [uncultured Ruegeria sp.]|uniref:hypothetical protein n=1 Tax=uncultured Ruegeria sp. TaxID=259304 RepID=UPI0026281C87|nr:hypothetical protein [uncultured Ruegeria sp.]